MATGDLLATFEFTGAPDAFVVPTGVGFIRVELYGGNPPGTGVQGVEATIPVTPGESLTVIIGGLPEVPETPDLDGYWTTPGGWNGGGMGRSFFQPTNPFYAAGGGCSELLRGGDPLLVAPGAAGGWSAFGFPREAETTIQLVDALPSESDAPRVPLDPEPGWTEQIAPTAGGPHDGAPGGYGFYGPVGGVFLFNVGGGGGYGGGASSGTYTDGFIPKGTLSRPGAAYVAPDLVGGMGPSGTVLGLIYESGPANEVGWGVGHIKF